MSQHDTPPEPLPLAPVYLAHHPGPIGTEVEELLDCDDASLTGCNCADDFVGEVHARIVEGRLVDG